MHKNGKQKRSPLKLINKILLILIGICIVICIILSIIAIAKNISEEPPAEEYTEPPFIAEMTTSSETTVTTTVTTAATAVTTTAAATVAEDYEKGYFDNWLFIGDSIFTGLYGYDYLDSSQVFAKIGFTPENIRTSDINGTTVYQKLAVTKPETICIMLGTNGVAYLTAEQMAADYGKFIDEIRDLLPDSKIIILTITPVTKEHSDQKPENLTLITAYNEALAVLAEEKETDFLDVFEDLSDDDDYTKSEYAENDGLHLKSAAYARILSLLETYTKGEEETESAANTEQSGETAE